MAGGYMATKDAWSEAGLSFRDCQCLPCFERRLGRPVAASDFLIGALINDNLFFGFSKQGGRSLDIYIEHTKTRSRGI